MSHFRLSNATILQRRQAKLAKDERRQSEQTARPATDILARKIAELHQTDNAKLAEDAP